MSINQPPTDWNETMIKPVKFILDTPTLENAIMRIEIQFVLDHIVVERVSLRGNGNFDIHTPNFIHTYSWSHETGTHLINSELKEFAIV